MRLKGSKVFFRIFHGRIKKISQKNAYLLGNKVTSLSWALKASVSQLLMLKHIILEIGLINTTLIT